jgi:hypothetical protein
MNTYQRINTLSHAMTEKQLAYMCGYLIGYFSIELEREHGEVVLKHMENLLRNTLDESDSLS